MTMRELRIRLDQSALGNQPADLILRKSSFAQNLAALFAEARRVLSDRRRRLAPGCGGAGDTQGAFGRMLDRMKQANRGEMRVVDQAVEVVQRRM